VPHLVDMPSRIRTVHGAVLAQLREGGTEAVTMRRVAAAAGLSLGSLRENWPTRDVLLDFTVAYAVAQRGDRFRAALFSRRTRDATFLARGLLPLDGNAVLLDRAYAVLDRSPGLSARSLHALRLQRRGRRMQCGGTVVETLGREPGDLDVLSAWLHATVEGLTDDLCRLDQPMSVGTAVSLLHETVEIVVGRAGRRPS
jgi:AcrR family transcriptional regulator